MYSFTSFFSVVTILTISSMISSIRGLPAQPNWGAPSVILPLSGRCYVVDPNNEDIGESIQELAADSEGRPCFEPIDSQNFRSLFDITQIDRNFANVTAEFCPTWPKSKQCLHDHLNSDKCNEENKQEAKNSVSLSSEIVLSELLCNPITPNYLLHLMKNASDEGLWNCFNREDFEGILVECSALTVDRNGRAAPFSTLSLFFDCVKPGLRKCAEEDPMKEAKLVSLWEEIDRALQDTFNLFWR